MNVVKSKLLASSRRKADLRHEHVETVLEGTQHLHNAMKEPDR